MNPSFHSRTPGPWRQPADRHKYQSWPRDLTASVGERVVLPCRTARREEEVQWTRHHFGMGFDRGLEAWDNFRMVGNDERECNELLFCFGKCWYCTVPCPAVCIVPKNFYYLPLRPRVDYCY